MTYDGIFACVALTIFVCRLAWLIVEGSNKGDEDDRG